MILDACPLPTSSTMRSWRRSRMSIQLEGFECPTWMVGRCCFRRSLDSSEVFLAGSSHPSDQLKHLFLDGQCLMVPHGPNLANARTATARLPDPRLQLSNQEVVHHCEHQLLVIVLEVCQLSRSSTATTIQPGQLAKAYRTTPL